MSDLEQDLVFPDTTMSEQLDPFMDSKVPLEKETYSFFTYVRNILSDAGTDSLYLSEVLTEGMSKAIAAQAFYHGKLFRQKNHYIFQSLILLFQSFQSLIRLFLPPILIHGSHTKSPRSRLQESLSRVTNGSRYLYSSLVFMLFYEYVLLFFKKV